MTEPVTKSLAEEVLRGDALAVSRAITHAENATSEGIALLKEIAPHVGQATRLGVTGPPGVGKSTLIDALAELLRKRGDGVGVVAVDPTSPFTGGALLGDRIRMSRIAEDDAVFMRSMATRGTAGGLARTTQDAADIIDASGRKVLLIETVGVGQAEIEISRETDCVLLLLSPESGDGIQAMKSGILEVADIVVINKADRVGADKLEYDIRSAFELGLRPRREVPILLTEAYRGRGVPELLEAIDDFTEERRKSGRFDERRRRNMEIRIRTLVEFMIQKTLLEGESAKQLAQRVEDVLAKKDSAYAAAETLVREVVR